MDNIPYQMISNLRPNIRTDWRLKVRVTRMWQHLNREAETIGMNFIFGDSLGGRIHAWIPAQHIHQQLNHITEGETYDVRRFIVRQYADMQIQRCFQNDIFIQLNHMTEIAVTEGVDFIPPHVFAFTDLAALMDAASEDKYLIDVVGILRQVQPITKFKNKYRQEKSSIQFTITDIFTLAEVEFYDELAEQFQQAIRDAVQHPIIVIISSCRARFFADGAKLTNLPATRFFINQNHEAVEDLRNAIRLSQWGDNQ